MPVYLYTILQNEEDFYDIDLNDLQPIDIDKDKSCYDIFLSRNKKNNYKPLKKINETKYYKNWITELL